MKTRSARKARKANWPLRILVIAGVAFLFIEILRSHSQLSLKEQELTTLSNNIQKQVLINEDLAQQKEDTDSILEREANEAGLFLPGQQIFQGSAG